MKKRVLQISHDYEMAFAGICAKYVRVFSPRDYEVTTVYVRGSRNEAVAELTGGHEVIFLEQPEGSQRGIKFGTIGRILAICRRRSFDVVIAHRYKPIYYAGIASYFFRFERIIGVVHEFDVFARITRKLFVTFWRRDIHLLAVSDAVAADVLARCPSLKSGLRVATHHNCIDASLIDGGQLDRGVARQRLGFDGDGFVFGTIGRLVGKKDHETLIRGFALLADDRCRMALIGDGPREQRLRALAAELGIEERVEFVGHVDNASRYLKALDAFVMSSGTKEAFGIVLLEAMYSKVPIVCSDAAGPREVLGEAGLVFRSGDARDLAAKMASMLDDDGERDSRCQLGRERVLREFTPDRFRERFWELGLVGSAPDREAAP